MDIRAKSGKEAFAASHAAVLTGVQQYAVLIDLFGLRSDGATAVVYANAIYETQFHANRLNPYRGKTPRRVYTVVGRAREGGKVAMLRRMSVTPINSH